MEILFYGNGKKTVAIDSYEMKLGEAYVFIITSEDGKEKEEIIQINEYYHKITKKLGEGINIDNVAIKTEYNKPYEATIIAEDEYEINSLQVKMGGVEITSDENNIIDKTTGYIKIENVTGDIEIVVMSKATNGLILHYDASKNTYFEYSNDTSTWYDLSGNGNNGTLYGNPTWGENYLNFDGENDYVRIAPIKIDYPTIMAVYEYKEIQQNEDWVISNMERGGIALGAPYGWNVFQAYVGGYKAVESNETEVGKKYCLIGTYTGTQLTLYENGEKYELKDVVGKVSNPNESMILGGNPHNHAPEYSILSGKIYAIKVFDRSLTDEEILKEYEINKNKYNIEE